jgi:hypothetical protein
MPRVHRIGQLDKYNRDDRRRLRDFRSPHRPVRYDHIRRRADKVGRVSPDMVCIARAPHCLDFGIAIFRPPQLLRGAKCLDTAASLWVALHAHEQSNFAHPLALLRARRERPRRSAADQDDELAPFRPIFMRCPGQGCLAA